MVLIFPKLRDMIYFTRKEKLTVIEYSVKTGATIVQYDHVVLQRANDFNYYLSVERMPFVE